MRYARVSGNRLRSLVTSAQCYTSRQDNLVGRREIRPISQANQVIGPMHGLARRGYSGLNQDVNRAKLTVGLTRGTK